MNFIKSLSDKIQDLNLLLIGGKALSLVQLYQGGFLIPNSFIITTEAFDYFLESQMKDYKSILTQIRDNVDYSKSCLYDIQQKIISKTLPTDLSRIIYNSFLSLNKKFIAIRSSATFEDSDKYSFAGQFESFLGVTEEDLLSKVQSCWASLFSPRAIAYLKGEKGFGKMAVIIQEMIDADVSGVCFSVNPVTRNLNSVVIEAILGIGEPLVQGTIVPDYYVIDKKTLSIQDKRISHQKEKLGLNASSGGTKDYWVSDEKMQRQKVSDDIIKEVAGLVLKVEKFYNKPVDIEWALRNKKLYLLQGRPITTI